MPLSVLSFQSRPPLLATDYNDCAGGRSDHYGRSEAPHARDYENVMPSDLLGICQSFRKTSASIFREDMNRGQERTNSKGRHSLHTAPTGSLVVSVFPSLKSLSRADYFHPEHGSRKYFRNIRKLVTLHGVISQKTKYQFRFASLPGMDAHNARI
jgi:hypothetical protein